MSALRVSTPVVAGLPNRRIVTTPLRFTDTDPKRALAGARGGGGGGGGGDEPLVGGCATVFGSASARLIAPTASTTPPEATRPLSDASGRAPPSAPGPPASRERRGPRLARAPRCRPRGGSPSSPVELTSVAGQRLVVGRLRGDRVDVGRVAAQEPQPVYEDAVGRAGRVRTRARRSGRRRSCRRAPKPRPRPRRIPRNCRRTAGHRRTRGPVRDSAREEDVREMQGVVEVEVHPAAAAARQIHRARREHLRVRVVRIVARGAVRRRARALGEGSPRSCSAPMGFRCPR